MMTFRRKILARWHSYSVIPFFTVMRVGLGFIIGSSKQSKQCID